MDSFENFNETYLPKKDFYSKLNDSEISEEDHEHAKKAGKNLK